MKKRLTSFFFPFSLHFLLCTQLNETLSRRHFPHVFFFHLSIILTHMCLFVEIRENSITKIHSFQQKSFSFFVCSVLVNSAYLLKVCSCCHCSEEFTFMLCIFFLDFVSSDSTFQTASQLFRNIHLICVAQK
jgi:hypothetical protein